MNKDTAKAGPGQSPAYICVHGRTSAELTEKVNKAITEGFIPIGGASCSVSYVPEHCIDDNHWGRDLSIVQAMLRGAQ